MGIIGFLLKAVAWFSLIIGPIALLVLFQLQFLPYHSEWITNWQRIAVVIDLVLLWILWPRIARGETALLGRKDFKRVKVRTEAPSHQNGEGALVEAPQSGPKYSGLDCPDKKAPCDWAAASFAALKSLIKNTVPAGLLRDQALTRIATLEKPPFVDDEAAAKGWAALAEISARSPKPYWDAVTTILREIGCDSGGAPYVVEQLIAQLYGRFENNPAEAAVLATTFLDEAHCPGARGLGMERGKLQNLLIQARAPPAPGPAVRQPSCVVGSRRAKQRAMTRVGYSGEDIHEGRAREK
jgi:hypothetical protein